MHVGIANSRWQGKRSRQSQVMSWRRNSHFETHRACYEGSENKNSHKLCHICPFDMSLCIQIVLLFSSRPELYARHNRLLLYRQSRCISEWQSVSSVVGVFVDFRGNAQSGWKRHWWTKFLSKCWSLRNIIVHDPETCLCYRCWLSWLWILWHTTMPWCHHSSDAIYSRKQSRYQ